MAKRYSLSQIDSINENRIFFDANVLIYIFFSSGRHQWEEKYASAYGQLLDLELELCCDFQVISEIVNRVHRIEYNNYCKKKNLKGYKYKEYRNSQNGKESLADIYTTIKYDILSNLKIIENKITHQDILNFLDINTLDFVDKAIVQCCKNNYCVLITNDNDFKYSDVDILTSLNSLLN